MAYDGNFRPPINRLKPQDLMPLSRQPRAWTSQFTTPGFADFSKKLRNPTEACNTREVITDKLNTSVRATEYKRIETPIEQPNETKYSVQDVMNISANSGKRTQDLTEQYVIDPSSGTIINNPLQANAVANKSTSQNFVNNNTFNTDNYIQDANSHLVNSNLSGNKLVSLSGVINLCAFILLIIARSFGSAIACNSNSPCVSYKLYSSNICKVLLLLIPFSKNLFAICSASLCDICGLPFLVNLSASRTINTSSFSGSIATNSVPSISGTGTFTGTFSGFKL